MEELHDKDEAVRDTAHESEPVAKEIKAADTGDNSRYTYRWTYHSQTAHELQAKRTWKRRNALAYTFVLGGMFLLCIALLTWSVVWYGVDKCQLGTF